MKIEVHRYTLTPTQTLNAVVEAQPREGALLKVAFPEGIVGFADLHPWPEFADEPLDAQLQLLREGRPSFLAERSIHLARRDAEARAERRPLRLARPPLENNALLAAPSLPREWDQLVKDGFKTVKLKCGRHPASEAAIIKGLVARGDLRIRLDFNSSSNRESLEDFFERVDERADAFIEYVEDPSPYDEETWNFVRERWPVAIDFEIGRSPWARGQKPAADVLILKPARMDVEDGLRRAREWDLAVTVTSMMDHPVGVAHAAALAEDLRDLEGARMRTAGCLTVALYEPDAFSQEIPVRGPFLDRIEGVGIGFDDLLEALPWRPL